jgi:hypothetical protein
MTGNLDNMSEKELESKLKQILEDHKNIINITPEDITSSDETSFLEIENNSGDQGFNRRYRFPFN